MSALWLSRPVTGTLPRLLTQPSSLLSLQGLISPVISSQQQQTRAYSMPHWQNVEITAEGEPAATAIKSQDNNTFTIRDRASDSCEEGATPISHFLGAIVSGSQGALTSSAREMNLQVGHVKWHASGKYDVRGVRGEEGSVSQLKSISIVAELDSNASAQQLEDLRAMVQKRSILANTISKVQGLDFIVEYKSAFNFQSSMGTHM
ncbi:TPA: hypothetical protein ACH3X3_011698 [Trebouxia sp. C0006]